MGQVLMDSDLGVRNWALRSVQGLKPRGWREQVEALVRGTRLVVQTLCGLGLLGRGPL